MGLYEVRHHFRELDLVFERGNFAFGPWQQRGQAVDVIRVYLGYVRVRDDDEGQVLKRLYSVGQTSGQDRQRKVG